jgi:hypothetical protein
MLSFSKGEMVLDVFVFVVFVFVCDFHLTCFSFFFFFCSCWLPTGGTGKSPGGLNAFNFLCVCTWMRVHNTKESQGMVRGQCRHGASTVLSWHKGLEGRARAAETRRIAATNGGCSSKKQCAEQHGVVFLDLQQPEQD